MIRVIAEKREKRMASARESGKWWIENAERLYAENPTWRQQWLGIENCQVVAAESSRWEICSKMGLLASKDKAPCKEVVIIAPELTEEQVD